MDDAVHPASRPRVVRKSSYGRTQLVLPEGGAVFREVRCMGGIVRRERASVYHPLADARDVAGAACWHCCEPIEDNATAIPLPRIFDPNEQVYHVYGRTCSPGCAKAYVIEHTTFDRGQHLNTLVRMLREVYGVEQPVVETPPRPALRRFGGSFDPRGVARASCRVLHPPFVSYCMIVEEHGTPATSALPTEAMDLVEDADGLDEPPPPAAFDQFLLRRGTDAPRRASPKRPAAAPAGTDPKRPRATGPMSRFCK